MELEFELNKSVVSNQYIYYTVKRKGLEVGQLILNKEPYGMQSAERKMMVLTNNFLEPIKQKIEVNKQ